MKVLAVAVLLAVAGVAAAQGDVKFYKTPIEAADANNLVAFSSAIKDNGLAPVLNKPGLIATVFAPSDKAFKELADSTDPKVQKLLADKKKLAEVLKYHVVPGATLTGERLMGMVSEGDGKAPYKTLQGEKLNATVVDGSLAVNGVPVEGVDVQGGKVMIHTISHVLVPPSIMPPAAGADAEAAGATGAAENSTAAASGASAVTAAGLALAVPLAMAALL